MPAEQVLYKYLIGVSPVVFRAWMKDAELDLVDLPELVVDSRLGRRWSSAPDGGTEEWLHDRAEELSATLLRHVDPPDDDIAELLSDDLLPRARSGYDVHVMFDFGLPSVDSDETSNAVSLAQLAVASSLYTEMYLAIAAAHRPLGLVLEPPAVSVRPGSIQFGTSGALLPVAVGILIATGAGAIALPVGIAGGSALAVAGLYDTYLGWRRTIAERQKFTAEAEKLRAEAAKLHAEADKLTAEARAREETNDDLPKSALAYSSTVPREQLQEAARSVEASEVYVAHVLNRALPAYFDARQYAGSISAALTESHTHEPEPASRGKAARRMAME